MTRTRIALTLAAAAVAALAIGAGAWALRGGAGDPPPAISIPQSCRPCILTAPGVTVEHALEAAAADLGLPVPVLARPPDDALLPQDVAVERSSADDPGRGIVVDYYDDSLDPEARWEYEGLRAQVTFRPPVNSPSLMTDDGLAPPIDIGVEGVAVVGTHTARGGVYLIGHPEYSVMVAVWNTSGGPVPTPEDILPFLQSLAR